MKVALAAFYQTIRTEQFNFDLILHLKYGESTKGDFCTNVKCLLVFACCRFLKVLFFV